MASQSDEDNFSWSGVGTATGALLAALVLLGMVFFVAMTSRARDQAVASERHAYDVTLLTRTLDASIARAEAALGRFVLDEDNKGSGNIYYSQWRLAGQQLVQLDRLVAADPAQRARVDELEALYQKRGAEFALAARATVAKKGGAGYLYTSNSRENNTGNLLSAKLSEIANSERRSLEQKMAQSVVFTDKSQKLTDYLSVLGAIVGFGAIFLGWVAVRAIRLNALSRKQAETESDRAAALEEAVRERTQELWEANKALKAEAAEREAAEAQLRQVQKMEAVGQLTGGIAHDFNTLLAVVVGGLDLAQRRLRGPRKEVLHHLTNAMEGATRAAALTRRLLSFARSEPLLPERVDSRDLVNGMSELLDRTLGERIKVETKLDAAAWPVFVDSHQLENAILNLAVNARDAMDGTGTLTITTENVTLAANEVGDIRGGEYLKLAVSDTGCGMTEEVRERAFEPFFTTKPMGKGTGLGLSQIFGFAHQSGGEVGIESQLGKGTTVSLYLPRTEAAAAVRLYPQAAGSDSEPTVPGARIMLVEDDPRVRAATVGALEDLDYQPIACPGGKEAIELFDSQEFDLIISDVIMPEMTGPELIRILKARKPGIAVLFVTGYVGEGESEDLIGYELLRKPFTVGALASAVAAALARPVNEPRRSGGAAAAG
jgi:signal transduction histidine kinase/CheY-like chemotaxis protein